MEKKISTHAKAAAKYNKKNIFQVLLQLNKKTDEDIIMKLDSVQNRTGYIKSLIREDIRKENQCEK